MTTPLYHMPALKRITVVERAHGSDQVWLTLNETDPNWPHTDDFAVKFSVTCGTGAAVCREMFPGAPVEVIQQKEP